MSIITVRTRDQINARIADALKRIKANTRTTWCIAETPAAAIQVGYGIWDESLPELYATEADCLAAWRAYPAPLASRHHPYRLTFYPSSAGFPVVATSRLDLERKHGSA